MISRAHRIRLCPTKSQVEYLQLCCLLRKKAYNWAYDVWNEQYSKHLADNTVEKPSLKLLSRQFTLLRHSLPESRFHNIPRAVGERGIKDLCTSWSNYFKGLKSARKVGRPKRTKTEDRFYVHNAEIEVNGKSVRIGRKCDGINIRMRESLRHTGKIMSANVSTKNGNWYISIQTQINYNVEAHPHPGSNVGLDLGAETGGTTNLVVASDGEFYTYPEDILKLEKRIKRAQRKLSNMWCGKPQKGHEHKAFRNDKGQLLTKSNRYCKQSAILAKLYERLSDVRSNCLHHASTAITDKHECVYVEELKISNMTRSRKGKGRSAKASLNKAILNSCMSEFRRQLVYKADTKGGHVESVDPAYTSQTCPDCGHVSSENRPARAKFRCQKCMYENHADVVAAINVFKKGIRQRMPESKHGETCQTVC